MICHSAGKTKLHEMWGQTQMVAVEKPGVQQFRQLLVIPCLGSAGNAMNSCASDTSKQDIQCKLACSALS